MEHARQTLIEGWDQRALRETRAMVAGCGALGSSAAVNLGRLGVGHLTLIDYDILEEHNLENQEYTRHNIGQRKVAALADRIDAIDPSLEVRAWTGELANFAGDMDFDVLLGCFDNVRARYDLTRLAVDHRIPLIDAGIDRHKGTVMTILPGTTACYYCHRMLPVRQAGSCDADPIASTFLIARATAAVQANQLVKLAHGDDVTGHLYIDLDRGVVHRGNVDPNPDCIKCGDLQ